MMDVVASLLGATSAGQSAHHIQNKAMRFVFLPIFFLLLSSRNYVTSTGQTASTEPLQSSSSLEEEIIFTEATDVIFSSTMFIQPSSTSEIIESSINDTQQIMTSSIQMYSSPLSVETSSLMWESSVYFSMANSSVPFMETASSEAIMVSSSEFMVISSEFSEIIIASSSMEMPLPSMSAFPSVLPTTNTTAAPPRTVNLGLILGVSLGVGIPVLLIIVLLVGFCVRKGGVSQSMTSIKKTIRPKARSYDMYDDFTTGNNISMQQRAPSNGHTPHYAYDNQAYGTTKYRA